MTDADGEQLETQHWLEVSEECEYVNSEKAKGLLQKCESIGKMLQSMIDKSSTSSGEAFDTCSSQTFFIYFTTSSSWKPL